MSLREKLLDALDNADGELCNHYGEQCPEQTTDAALATFRLWLAENGLVVVPREATEGMIEAGWFQISCDHPDQADMARGTEKNAWSAMIAAAPDALGGEK